MCAKRVGAKAPPMDSPCRIRSGKAASFRRLAPSWDRGGEAGAQSLAMSLAYFRRRRGEVGPRPEPAVWDSTRTTRNVLHESSAIHASIPPGDVVDPTPTPAVAPLSGKPSPDRLRTRCAVPIPHRRASSDGPPPK
ncbi:MAG: hypothetical protein M3494_18490 [Actinomycetota bacterium]|nr:hypothetical protein [Rubrobacter sp.]MDQ3509963.1 hypothetical protein [Actinomycetota bacterium]